MNYRLIFERRGEITCQASFGRIVWVIVKELRENYDTLTPKDRKVLTSLLNQTLRQFTDDRPEYVSKKVADIIFFKDIKLNPFDMSDDKRRLNFGKGINRTVVFEHLVPVKQLLENLIKQVKDVNEVCTELSNYAGTALITTKEDKCLTDSGGRTYREDWKASYQSCGIELLDEQQFGSYIKDKTERLKSIRTKFADQQED